MQFQDAYIPYGCYWSTPFSKWQMSFKTLEPIPFAAEVSKRALAERSIPLDVFDGACLGLTIPSHRCFYGGPWLTALIGLKDIPAPMLSQACATGVRCIAYAAQEIVTNSASVFLAITADKCSNGPHLVYPDPQGQGGTVDSEDWVLDNFGFDPVGRKPMFVTAENVAKEHGIERSIQDEVALMRYEQYQNALKDDRAFQKRYMISPIEVKDKRGRKVLATVNTDEGVFPTTAEGLAKLKPVMEGGTVTFGTQTFPADGNAGVVVTTREKAKELSRDPKVEIQVVAHAQARVKPAFMPMANGPAVKMVLERAGIGVKDVKAMTSHTPFCVNDVFLSKEYGIDLKDMNRYGCSLVWGHPQGPTGMRGIIELIEELAILGGGWGLFTGCAAGDSSGAMVVKVDVS
jgi:acetyl-CoA acetyltransferase family protein